MSNTEFLHITGKTLPTSSEATLMVKNQLRELDLLPADMATKAATVAYVKAVGNELIPVSSVDQADFVQVALQRENILQDTTDDRCRPITREYSYVEPAGQISPIVGIVGRNWVGQDSIVSLVSTYEDYDWNNYGVYAARTLEDAWSAVLGGTAYVANLGTTSDVVISTIRLAYFEDSKEQAYLQPVYVFESDSGHRAYVPALLSSEFDTNSLLNAATSGSLTLPSSPGSTASAVVATPAAALPDQE